MSPIGQAEIFVAMKAGDYSFEGSGGVRGETIEGK
jgi:transcriptional regulator of nitric oxide reductase